MYTWRDMWMLLLCVAVWLGPFLLNGLRGRFRLMHPATGFFPIMIVVMLVSPLWFRWNDETILKTSQWWASDAWFLAEPMLVLAFTGLFYHLGVRLSGVSLILKDVDDARLYIPMPVLKDLPLITLLPISVLMILLFHIIPMLIPTTRYYMGFYWTQLLISSFQLIPLAVFHRNRWAGLLLLLAVFPLTLLSGSKGTFLYIPLVFLTFYDYQILRISKTITAAIVGMVLLTPLAVATYGQGYLHMNRQELRERIKLTSWAASIESIAQRDYAFEAFACVYQWRRSGEPLHYGKTFGNEILDTIPSFIYWGKEARFFGFVEQYLPRDAHGYLTHYARHLMSPFLLDFDIPGCCCGILLMGLFFGFCYRIARNASLRLQQAWPLMIYTPLMVMTKYFVEGGITGGLPRALGMMAGLGAALLVRLISPSAEQPLRS